MQLYKNVYKILRSFLDYLFKIVMCSIKAQQWALHYQVTYTHFLTCMPFPRLNAALLTFEQL